MRRAALAAAAACAFALASCGEDPSSWSWRSEGRDDRARQAGSRAAQSAPAAPGRPTPRPTPLAAERRIPGAEAPPLFRYPVFAPAEPPVGERALREDDAGNTVAHGTFDDGELAFDVVLGVRLQARDRPVPVDKLDFRLILPAGQSIPYVGRVILWRAKPSSREPARDARDANDPASPWESRPLPGEKGPVAGDMIVVSEGFVSPAPRATWESALPALVKARVAAHEAALLLFEDLRRPESDPQRYKLLVPVKARGDAFYAGGLRGADAALRKGAYRVRVRGIGPAVLAGESEPVTVVSSSSGSPSGPQGATASPTSGVSGGSSTGASSSGATNPGPLQSASHGVAPGGNSSATTSGNVANAGNATNAGNAANSGGAQPPPAAPAANAAPGGNAGGLASSAANVTLTTKLTLPSAAAPGRLTVSYESRRGSPARALRIASRHDKAVDFSFHLVRGEAEGATAGKPFAHGVLGPGKHAVINLPRAGDSEAVALRYDDEAVFLDLPDFPSPARAGAATGAPPATPPGTRVAAGPLEVLPY